VDTALKNQNRGQGFGFTISWPGPSAARNNSRAARAAPGTATGGCDIIAIFFKERVRSAASLARQYIVYFCAWGFHHSNVQ
jgi:hypothetical protein